MEMLESKLVIFNFEGNVTVKGTVIDGYSIFATHDISILSEFGVCNIDTIQSELGDVFIKGGIFGKGKSRITGRKKYFC